MATMNVSLPDGLKKFVERHVAEQGYGTSSEFVRELIRREQQRVEFRELVIAGISSGAGSELNADYFENLRRDIPSHLTD